MRRLLRGILAFLAAWPLLALTALVSGAGESPTIGWTGVVIAVGFVSTAAIGPRARIAMLVLVVAGTTASLVLFSTLIPRRYDSRAELADAQLGLPFPFVEAEITYTPPAFPETAGWNPWEHPATADGLAFLASFGAVFVVLLAPALGLLALLRRRASQSASSNSSSSPSSSSQ